MLVWLREWKVTRSTVKKLLRIFRAWCNAKIYQSVNQRIMQSINQSVKKRTFGAIIPVESQVLVHLEIFFVFLQILQHNLSGNDSKFWPCNRLHSLHYLSVWIFIFTFWQKRSHLHAPRLIAQKRIFETEQSKGGTNMHVPLTRGNAASTSISVTKFQSVYYSIRW